MEDLAVIKALNHSGSFGKNFVKFKGRNKNVIYQPKAVHVGKTVPSVLSATLSLRLLVVLKNSANNIYLTL